MKKKKKFPKKLITGFWAIVLSTFMISAQQTVTIIGSTDDNEVRSNGTMAYDGASAHRVGGAGSGYDGCVVYPFQLPALSPGESILSASCSIEYSRLANSPYGNVDLYGLPYRTTSTVSASSDYWQGSYSSDPNTTALQDNFLTTSTPTGTVATNTAGNDNLADYINAQYAAGAQGGDYVFLRINPDIADVGNYHYWEVYTANTANQPVLELEIGQSDTEAPSVPTGLAAGAITANSVDLSWNASSDNVGVTGYKVYTNGSNPVTVASASATISGLSQATQYGFTVSAMDAAGNESAQSATLQVTTSDIQAPSVPTGLTAGAITANSVDLSWSASTDNVGVTGYKVFTNGSNPVSVTGTNATISGLSASTQYGFTVSALDAAGNESAQSAAVDATTSEATQQTVTIIGSTDDNEVRSNGTMAYDGASAHRVGGAGSGYDGCVVYPFQLPVLNSGESIISASCSIEYSRLANSPYGNVDLYGLPYRSTSTVSASSDYWQGSYSSDPNATALQDNFLTTSTPTGTVATNTAGNDNLADYINAQYAAGAQGGDYVFIRINPDIADVGNYNYWEVYTANTSNKPVLELTISQSSGQPDTEAPSVPTGLASGNVTTSSVGLNWNASTDNAGVTGYKVYTNGSNPVMVAGTSTTISGLTASTQYSFTVSAIDAASNESAQSSATQVTTATPADTEAPSVPTGLASSNVTTSSVDLSWSASTDNVGVTGYKIYTNGSNPVTVAGTSTTISGLTASTQYSFTVSAIDAASNESAQSSAIQVTTATPADTQDPSVPTGLTTGTVTSNSVGLSWNASTDNVGVTGYKVYTNGSNPVTVAGTSTTITGLAASTQYSFTVSAIDAASNESAQSSSVNATTSAASGVTSSATWQSFAVSNETGVFTATFDAVPNGNNIDALTGILNGSASAYGDIACIIRFYTNGQIDARNGGFYSSDNVVNYTSGVSYHFRVEISVPTHTYSVYVTPQGGSEQTVASNFSFRTEQSGVSQLTGWTLYASSGSHTVSNMAFTPAAPDYEAPSVPTGLSASNVYAISFTLSWNASTDNVGVTGYEVFKNGVSIGTTTVNTIAVTGLTESTTYSMTVRARDGVPNWSAQSSAINVTTSAASVDDWPTSSTTGPSGTLTSYSGDVTANTNGQIIENMDISGKIIIKANNVLIRNCEFGSLDIAQASNYTGCVVEDCYLRWAGRKNFTLRRCEMRSQSGDLIRVGGPNVTIEDCYLHIDGPRIGTDHSDLIQEYPENTGTNLVVRNNRMYNAMNQTSIVIGATDMLFENNLVAGGAYSIYSKPGQQLIDNHFSTIFFPGSGQYGPITGTPGYCSGNVWHESGAPLNCPSSGEVDFAEALQQTVKIYPNPLNGDILNIQLNGYDTETINVNIYDLTGRSMYNQLREVQSELKIPVDNLTKGIYIVSITGKGVSKQQKLIVE